MNGKTICAVLVALLALGIDPLAARELAKKEWYVRLVLTSETGALEDSYNTVGQLADALPDFDSYDLPELGQTWAGTYLSVIFYRPDWETLLETEAGVWVDMGWVNFNTDYHPISLIGSGGGCNPQPKTETGDEWTFEVRSDDTARDLRLTWDGSSSAALDRMVLVDLQENVAMPAVVDGAIQEYSFRMNGAAREFAWRLLSDQDYAQFVATGAVNTDPVASRQVISSPAAVGATSASAVTAGDAKTTGSRETKSGWLPMGWSPEQGDGYGQPVPEGLPDDPFGD